jgi:DNA repair protein RadC/GNAT superfamily N-acetyltransferase
MQRAVNPQTGEVLFLVDNEWKKPEQTAVNPKTGERAFLVNNAWEIMPAFKPPVGEVQSDTFAQTPEEMITPLPSDDRPSPAAGPDIPKSMSVGEYASDYGKLFAAPGIQGVAQAPRGLLDAGIAIPRAFATGEAFERGPLIARALDKSVQLVRNLFGTSLSEQQEERLAGKIAVDKAITEAKSLFEIPRLFEYLSEEGGDIADKLRKSVSSRTQQKLEGATPKGNFLEAVKTGDFSKLSLGDDPTLEGYAAQTVQVLGSLAPVIATAIITKGASAPTAVVGGGMAAGEGASTAREYIKNLSNEQLIKMSPYYANIRSAGIDESKARKIISDRAAEQAALLQGSVGAFGSVFTGKLATGQLDNYFTANIRSRLGRIVALGGVGAAEEGAQEFLEGVAADLGINKEVIKEIGAESFANLILGSIGGGAVGAGRGAISSTPPAPPSTERIEPTIGPEPPAPPATPPIIPPPVTPPVTPPITPDEEITPFLEGELEGEEAAPPREPIEEPPPMFGQPAPLSEDEIARRKEVKDLEAQQRTIGAPQKEENLFTVLDKKLDRQGLLKHKMDIPQSRMNKISAPKGKGRLLEDMIADGELDEFLPFEMRTAGLAGEISPDDLLEREQSGFEYMLDKLARNDPLTYENTLELRKIGYDLDQLAQEGKLNEVNRRLQEIANEELLGRTETITPPISEERVVSPEGAPGTEAARQAAQQAGVAPSLFGEEEAKESAAKIKAGLTRYASGMSGISDLETGAYTRAGYGRNGIGVDVSLLSKSATDALANAILNYRTPAFIDSGAFSAFRKQIKGQPVDPIDFDRVLAKYDEILTKIGELNPEERQDYPRPRFVMPDVVGDQDASVGLINRYKNWIATEVRGNLSDPIVPIQKGPRSLSEVYDEISNILGTKDFIVGVPSQEEAISKADLTEFLKTSQPTKIHFLGAASDKKLNPLLALVAQHSPNTEVSADASKVRSSILSGVAQGKTREQAIQDALRAEDDPYEVFNRYMEQASAPAAPKETKAAPAKTTAPEETVRVYHSGSVGEGETGRFVSTNLEYASNYRPDLPLFYLDLPVSDPRVQSDVPNQGVKQGFTFNFELTPEEAAQLKPIERTSQTKAAPAAESDVDKLAEAFPNVPRDLFEGAGSFAKVKPYIQAAYNKGNLKQVETILNSLRKAAPPIGQVREPQEEIARPNIYQELFPDSGFKRLAPEDSRTYKNKSGESFLTFERDGVRAAVKSNTLLYADDRSIGMYMGEPNDMLLQSIEVDEGARKQGKATKAMQDIVRMADEAGVTLYVQPVQVTKGVGMSTDQLKNFYKRFGFEPQKTEPATDRVMVRTPREVKAVPEEKRLADLERDLFRLTPPAIPERRAAPSAQADLFGVAGLESLPDRPQLQKQKRQNNQQLSLFGSQVIDPSENNTAGRKARKAAIDEVKALQETDTPMGLSFANEFAQKQRANLVGQKINSASDLAVLSQVYRDPSFETFRLFFTDADNNVISQLGVTSRLPGSSNAIIGNDLNKYLVEVQKAAKDVGAVGFWMLHNHPSGNVQSSGADRVLTKTFNKYMPGMNFLGHVIIDTNKYGLILPDGTYTEISKDMNQKDLIDFQLGSYETVFNPIEMAKKVDEDQDAMVVVVMNNSLQVTGITSLPNSDFVGKTPEQIQRRLMKTALRGMGSRLLVASRNRTALDAVASSVENGIHIKDNGQYENFNQMFKYRTILTFPLSRPGVVTADSSKLFDFLRKPKVADPGRSKYLNWTDLRVLEPQKEMFGDDVLSKLDKLPKDKSKLPPGRSPELAEITQRFVRGEVSRAERDEAVEKFKKVRVWEEVLEPATDEQMRNALNVVQRQKVNAPIPEGTKVGTRIDILAARKYGVQVVTIHEAKANVKSPMPGTAISYRNVAKLRNAKFAIGSEQKALDIAEGEKKDAIQTIEGYLVDITPAEAKREMEKALSDSEYIQIGFDPTAHSYFYDRVTKLPVISADEIIQIGNQVLAKGVEFQEAETFLYNITEDQSHLFEGEGVEKVDSIPAGVKKKVKKGRSPELAEMAEKLKRGEITKEDYDEAVNKFSRPALYAEIPKPATDKAVVDALSSDKRPYANVAISNGTKVGLRLDIPAFERYGVGVVSIHQAKPSLTSPKADKILSYRSVAGLKNVKFALGDQTKALNTAAGEFKDKLQTMEGEYVNYTPEEAFAKAQEVLNDPEYIQVGFNPIRHSYFYDRLTMLPVVSADEVIQIGQLVMAKGVEFGDKADFLYNIGDPVPRTETDFYRIVNRDREEILGLYKSLRQRRAALVRKIEEGEVSIDIQRKLKELNELGKEMQLDLRIMYEPNLSARAFKHHAETAYLRDEMSADVFGVLETMFTKYPKLLEGLKLSVITDKTLKDAAGQFEPIKRLVTLYKGTAGVERPMTIRHELSHAMEQMMTIGAREAMIREWSKAFQAAIRKHTDAKSQAYFQKVLEFLDRPSKARMEAATRVMPSYDFYQYLNPSEYWAINAEKLMAAQLGTPWNRFVKAMQRLLEGMKKILGFNNKYTTHKTFDQIISGSMKRLDRGSLLNYMIEGDTDIDFLMDVKKVDDLMDKYKRPDTPTDTSGSVKDMFMGSYEKAKQIAADIKESPLAPISKMASNIDRVITYARNKNIWFGTGLNQADFKRYNGQLRDSHKNVVASIAVDNAIHAGHVAVQVAMLGKLKYDNNIGMFTAVQDEKSMKNVIKLKAELVKQLGAQRAANVMNGYFEAKRSRNIIDEYLQREANYEQAMAEIDLSGTQNPADIKEAKDELESIEKAAEKVLMTDNEIDDFIALENEYPQLREMMENWQAVNRNLLDNMFFARIIGKKRYNKLKSIKDYVPWYRITDDMEDIHMPTAGAIRGLTDVPRERLFRKGVPQMTREILSKDGQQDFNVRMNPDAEVFVDNVKVDPSLYRLRPDRTLRFNDPIRGGQNVKVIQNRPIDNIIDNMLHNVMVTTKNVMRNYAALKVSQAYGTRNEKGKLKVFATEGEDADGVRFNVRIDGRKVIHQIKDPLIAESVLGLENFELPVNGILSYFANGFRRSITAFPGFQLKQLFMDAPTAAWVSGVKNPYKLWASVFSSFIAALNPNDPITQILRSKGIGGFQYAFRSPQKELEIEIGVIKGNLFSMAMKVLDKIGDASDIAQRRAIYKQLLKETGDETLALSMAQNVIDFLRRGSGVPAQFVTRTVAFAGAYAQAIDVLARTLAGGGLKGMDRKMAIANMVKNGMLLGAVTLLYTWAVGDDEEYQKLDDQTRARGFFIPGSKEVFGEPLILPMSTGASFFFKTVPEIAYNQVMRDGTETKMDETRLRTALSQAATDALLGPNMSPTAVKPFIEIALNRNFFTGTNMIPRGLEDVEAAEQYNATTSELGKVVSSLTSVPGTEKRLLAPIEADHLVRSLFGTVGATAMWGTNLLVEDRVDSRMRDNPLYGPFFLPPVPRGREDLFYDLKDRVDKKYETYTTKLDRGKDDEAEEYFDKNEDLIVQRDTTEQIAKILQEINKEIRLVGTSEDLGLSKKERTEMIRELQEEKNDVIDDITEIRREAGL